jgi:hypothetical protein
MLVAWRGAGLRCRRHLHVQGHGIRSP